jgi:hypothetical protein
MENSFFRGGPQIMMEYLLKHMSCTYCQEYQYVYTNEESEENDNKELNKNEENENELLFLKEWDLFIKEFENYHAFILYHSIYKKDIIEFIPKKTEIIYLKDEEGNIVLELEYVTKNEDHLTSIWVPTEKYYDYFEKLNKTHKKINKEIGGQFLGTYQISFR